MIYNFLAHGRMHVPTIQKDTSVKRAKKVSRWEHFCYRGENPYLCLLALFNLTFQGNHLTVLAGPSTCIMSVIALPY